MGRTPCGVTGGETAGSGASLLGGAAGPLRALGAGGPMSGNYITETDRAWQTTMLRALQAEQIRAAERAHEQQERQREQERQWRAAQRALRARMLTSDQAFLTVGRECSSASRSVTGFELFMRRGAR